jgi:hypothetical protein
LADLRSAIRAVAGIDAAPHRPGLRTEAAADRGRESKTRSMPTKEEAHDYQIEQPSSIRFIGQAIVFETLRCRSDLTTRMRAAARFG